MNFITKILRFILLAPLVIFVSPALVIFAGAILILETQEGTLRELFWLETKAYGLSDGFRRFMQNIFIPTYKNSIQGFVLCGAGFLVVTVGLRSLGVLSTGFVYIALGVEFMLLLVYGTVTYFTPLDAGPETYGGSQEPSMNTTAQALTASIKELNKQLGQLDGRMKATESKQDSFLNIQQTLQQLVQRIEAVLGANPEIKALRESNEKISAIMKETAAQIALLESRLRSTEAKFDLLNQLDGSVKTLMHRIELIAGDQFNLRVKREFEQLLEEIGGRISQQRSVR